MSKFTDCEWNKDGFRVSTDPTLLDFDLIYEYLTHSYWSPGISRELVMTAAENSLCFGIYAAAGETLQQVGYARMVSDFARFAYMADVFVLDEYQGKGLGSWAMECIMGCSAFAEVTSFFLYTQDAHGLYREVGFKTPKQYRNMMVYQYKADWYDGGKIRQHPNPP